MIMRAGGGEEDMSLEDKPDYSKLNSPQISQVWSRTEHEHPPQIADDANCFGHVTTLKFVPQKDHNSKNTSSYLNLLKPTCYVKHQQV
jgi:hypothetical protein